MSEANQKQLAEAFVGVFFRERTPQYLAEVLEAWRLGPAAQETAIFAAALERELETRAARETE